MLLRFRVKNFKSLVDVEFRPSGLNLLVGTNNAGKTNLCQALRFLSLSARLPLDEAAKVCTGESWNLLNTDSGEGPLEIQCECRLESSQGPLTFSYDLRLTAASASPRPLQVSTETLRYSEGGIKDCDATRRISPTEDNQYRYQPSSPVHRDLIVNEGGKAKLSDRPRVLPNSTTEPSVRKSATVLQQHWDLPSYANLFKQYLLSWSYHSFDSVQLRSHSAAAMDRELKADGSNLSSVLYTLHNERPREERRVIEAARLVEPRLDLISYQAPDPDHVYLFVEDTHGHKFGVQNLSDGTLRYLALCFLVVTSHRDDASAPASPLIMIEEPENGLYVGHLKSLFERLDPSGENGQFLFTSHNPYFIDLFDGAVTGVHVVKTVRGRTSIAQPDPSRVQRLLDEFSLGELHFREMLA